MRAIATMIACAAAATTIVAVGAAMSEQREIVIGIECDRTGPTQIIGVNYCPAYQDYINLINRRGGVEGYRIKGDEIDIEYKVDLTDCRTRDKRSSCHQDCRRACL